MSEQVEIIADLKIASERQRVIAAIDASWGKCRVMICKYRPRRSDRQNRYYWPCMVVPFSERLKAEGNEFDDAKEAAHEIFKSRYLRVAVVDEQTGERFTFVRSTTTLNTVEFNEFLDECARFLAELGIVVPEPSVYREPLSPKENPAVISPEEIESAALGAELDAIHEPY